MSNSSLVNYTRISPNRTSGRTHAIDTITIHCVVGQCSVETLGAVFAPSSRKASSNYGVGYDGRIGLYVEEKDRSWCSSSSSNDNRAVTIEVASDTTHPYAVRDAAYNATIKLTADICKRNGIKKLLWLGDKSKTLAYTPKSGEAVMTAHRWFANKACPGDYLYSRFGDIAEKVNALLGDTTTPTTDTTTSTTTEETTVSVTAQVLKNGSKGSAVKKLQILLNGLGYNCGTMDGDFGAKTLYAVRLYQGHNNLAVDGVVGAATWGALIG